MDWTLYHHADVTTLLVFVAIFLCVWSVILRERTNIPGPLGLPIIGNSLKIITTPVGETNQLLHRLSQKYGDIFRLRIGGYLFVFICGYDNLYNTFVKNGKVFNDRPTHLPNFRRTNASSGVLWSSGNHWKKVRRFTLQTLRGLGVGKESLEEIVLDEARKINAYFKNHQGKPIHEVRNVMTVGVSNVIHNLVFGFRYPHDNETFLRLIEAMDEMSKLFNFISIYMTMPLWLRSILAPKKAKEVIKYRKIINDYIAKRKEEHKKSFDEKVIRDFVDLNIKHVRSENNDGYDDNTMAVIIRNLFFAGTETTALTLDWSLLYMIAYPDIQRKCCEEIIKFVGDDRMVEMNDRSNLVYVEATLLEIQRLANIATVTLPHMAAEDTILNGYRIPKGTILLGLLSSSHLDPKYWEAPHDFKPERFIDAQGKIKKKESFIPFSLGPRVCIGESLAKMELFLVFSNLIQRFQFSKVNESDELSFVGVSGTTTSAKPYRLIASER